MARRRLTAGQSLGTALSAGDYNDLMSLLEHKDSIGLWAHKDKVTEPQHREHKGTEFQCWNATGGALPAGGIMGITSLGVDKQDQYGQLDREITLTGIVPAKKHLGAFAVCLEPIDSERFGPVAVAGAVPCLVNIVDKDHKFAECVEGSTTALESCVRGSAQIIWKAGEDGLRRCVVRLCNYDPPIFWKGTATDDFCPEDTTADFSDLEPMDGCAFAEEPPDEVTADNEEALAACEGGQVILVRNSGPLDTGWWILQTPHMTKTFVTSGQYTSCELQFPRDKAVVMSCCEQASPAIIPMYQHQVIRDVKIVKAGYTSGTASGTQVCTLQLQTATDLFCAFDPESTGALADHYTAITFVPLLVTVRVVDDADCIQYVPQYIYVLCKDDELAPIDVICREECNP